MIRVRMALDRMCLFSQVSVVAAATIGFTPWARMEPSACTYDGWCLERSLEHRLSCATFPAVLELCERGMLQEADAVLCRVSWNMHRHRWFFGM